MVILMLVGIPYQRSYQKSGRTLRLLKGKAPTVVVELHWEVVLMASTAEGVWLDNEICQP